MHTQDEPILPYVAYFAAAYAGLTIVVGGVFIAFDLPTNSGIGIGIIVASATFVGGKFAKDKGRTLSRSERLRMTGLCFLASLAISLLLFAGFVSMTQADGVWEDLALTLQELSWQLTMGMGTVVTVIYLLGIYVSFGLIAKQVLKAEQRKEKA